MSLCSVRNDKCIQCGLLLLGLVLQGHCLQLLNLMLLVLDWRGGRRGGK